LKRSKSKHQGEEIREAEYRRTTLRRKDELDKRQCKASEGKRRRHRVKTTPRKIERFRKE
jgi:hypothetical protein